MGQLHTRQDASAKINQTKIVLSRCGIEEAAGNGREAVHGPEGAQESSARTQSRSARQLRRRGCVASKQLRVQVRGRNNVR